jgi:hypothetical protein
MAAAVLDTKRQVVVLYGGAGIGSGTRYGDTWAVTPGPRQSHLMAYDSRRERVVMYGGIGGTNQRLSDTWEWDGRQWHRIVLSSGPGARSHHRMAYDAARGVVVLFGGGDSTATDTWTYDGNSWQRHQEPGPSPRWSSAMAYDALRQRVVLFGGGRNVRPYASLDDTWEWDGAQWREIRLSP